jgi:non-ribosomal peptide synthetase component F
VRETTLGAYQHQELPFERLVEELAPERTLGRNPLVQTIFTLQTDVPPEELAAGAVRIAVQGAATGATRFDWELHVVQVAGALKAVAVFNSDLFDAATADALLARYARLLERMVAEPDRRLSEVELLSRDER